MTRVLIVASSAVVRAGLEAILTAQPMFEVVSRASGADGLGEQIDALRPDVVLYEPPQDALPAEALPSLAGDNGPPGFVVLSHEPSTSELVDALRHGARGILPRDAEPGEIVAAVQAASVGLVVIHPTSASVLLPLVQSAVRTTAPGGSETLTPRELEVLGMLAEGEGNKQIARRMGISEHTVKFHVGSILAKLSAASRTEAVTIGLRQGLIMM